MPKVKLIKVYDFGYCDYTDSVDITTEDITDWEEISDSDLKMLQSWNAKRHLKNQNIKLVILSQLQNALPKTIEEMKAQIIKQKENL